MEEPYGLSWDDSAVVQTEEEVICGIESDMLDQSFETQTEQQPDNNAATNESAADEELDNNSECDDVQSDVVYLPDGTVLVMNEEHNDEESNYQDFLQVSEEVVTDQWGSEEIVVGSEEAIVGTTQAEDVDIPLPTDQDEYMSARPYPCDFCSRRFRKKANLMNHMVAHQTDRPHGCNLCGVRYIRKCDLMNHLKIHAYTPETAGIEDEEEVQLDDSIDQKTMKRKKRKVRNVPTGSKVKQEVDHSSYEPSTSLDNKQYFIEPQSDQQFEITDPRKPFVCQHCGVCFAREKALASHSRVHGGDSMFECRKCSEMFWNHAQFKDHMRVKHQSELDDSEQEEDNDEDTDYSDEDSKYGTFYCPTCGLSFHRQDNLRRHQKVHIKEEYVNEHEFGHICNVCGESFPEALDLLAHAEAHARGHESRCMICGETCSDEQSLQEHVQSKHKNLPPNTCLSCGRTCKDRRTLLKHSWEHSKEKMFQCTKCSKTFHNKPRLKRHMLSHRNKVVSCDVCGEEFPDGRTLMNHRHSHSSVSGRQFPCRECGKTFGSRSSQQIHIRIHTGERPYGCRFCWKAFADGGTLRKHERIHTGEKPYACAVCPRAFNQRVVLREHIRSHHSGPDPNYSHSMTPYCCSVCSDMFATSQDLILHLIHHCDMNTAMKRQPQVGPRKYKRRRKLKPHELEMMSNSRDDDQTIEDCTIGNDLVDEVKTSDDEPMKPKTIELVEDHVLDTISPNKPKTRKLSKSKLEVQSRPKMIHTQKQRVVDSLDGRARHKTKTMVTRTEVKQSTDRIRPRTKNVSYHIYNPDKPMLATFPNNDDTEQAVNNLLSSEDLDLNMENNGLSYEQPQTIDDTNMRKRTRSQKHVLSPGSKVRIVKSGMLVQKTKIKTNDEDMLSDTASDSVAVKLEDKVVVKQELDLVEASPLHELAEISMQHAQSIFKCEMCSEVFSDRAQLLVHVPIHI